MRTVLPIAAALCLTGLVAHAEDNQAFLGVFAETSGMKIAGMPAMPAMPNLPPGVKLPPGVAEMMSGKPTRKLTVRLWSPGIAADNASASLAIPDGLKLGPKLDLLLYRPKPVESRGEDVTTGPNAINFSEFVIKRYWGSSKTVRDGQPETTEFKGLNAEQKARMKEQSARARQGGAYFYKPDWTTGYWPADNQPPRVEAEAALQGHYALTTNYTGNVEIDVPSEVNFLDGITMSSPDLTKKINFDEFIGFSWAKIPNALGLYAQVVGMQMDKKTMIIWSSSEARPEIGMMWDYLQMAEVRKLVTDKQMMPGDTTGMSIPAGIFKDCDFVSFMMIGYGPGAALDKAQPLPRVQTKTTLTIMLGGKMAQGMGGQRGGGMPNLGGGMVSPGDPKDGE